MSSNILSTRIIRNPAAAVLLSLAAVTAFATPSLASYPQLDSAAAVSAAASQGAQLQTAARPVVLAYKPDCKSQNGKNPCN